MTMVQEYFDSNVTAPILRLAPSWDKFDANATARPGFNAEVERILAEAGENKQ